MKRFFILVLTLFITFTAAAIEYDGFIFKPFSSKKNILFDLTNRCWEIETPDPNTIKATPAVSTMHFGTLVDYVVFSFSDDKLVNCYVSCTRKQSTTYLYRMIFEQLSAYEYQIVDYKWEFDEDLTAHRITAANENCILGILLLSDDTENKGGLMYTYYYKSQD